MRTMRASLLGFALVAVLAIGACGGGGSDGVATLGGEASGSGDDDQGDDQPTREETEQAFEDWAQCMRDHGVDVPDPEFNENGRGGGPVVIEGNGPAGGSEGETGDSEAFKDAEKACEKHLEGVVNDAEAPDLSPEEQRALREHALALAQCMRDEGIDMPDPEFTEDGGISLELPEGGPTPEFEAAQGKCLEEVGDPPGIDDKPSFDTGSGGSGPGGQSGGGGNDD